jgi:DNA-directed RNA polymerase specialized sigma24 family protein
MSENQIVKQLQGIALRLTGDPDQQRDLMQEMFVHLIRIQTAEPGQALSWYLKSCEFRARNYLKPGPGVDAPRRAGNGLLGDEVSAGGGMSPGNGTRFSAEPVGPIEIQGELITSDVLNLILPLLSDMRQRVLFLLMRGCGVREAARELGITHPAVIKHRKKIARIARELLQESEGVGVAVAVRNCAEDNGNGNGNGNGHGNGNGSANGEAHAG